MRLRYVMYRGLRDEELEGLERSGTRRNAIPAGLKLLKLLKPPAPQAPAPQAPDTSLQILVEPVGNHDCLVRSGRPSVRAAWFDIEFVRDRGLLELGSDQLGLLQGY